MERLPLGDTPYFSIYFRDCILGSAFVESHLVKV